MCVCLDVSASNDERQKEDSGIRVRVNVVGILSATPMRPDNLMFYTHLTICQSICLIHQQLGKLASSRRQKDLALK